MESADGKLGRAIDGPSLNTVSASGARNRGNHRAGPSPHQRDGGARAVKDAVDIGVDHPTPIFGPAAREAAEDTESCVDEEEVEALEPLANLLEEGAHLIDAATSVVRAVALSPSSSANTSIRSCRLAERMTCNPSATSSRAAASPIPLEAPVTTAVLSVRSCTFIDVVTSVRLALCRHLRTVRFP